MTTPHHEQHGERRLVAFLQDCRALCETIESAERADLDQWMHQLQLLLPRLYSFVATLPQVSDEETRYWEELPHLIGEETIAYYEARVADLLGDDEDLLLDYSSEGGAPAELHTVHLSHLLLHVYGEVGVPLALLKAEQYDLIPQSLSQCRIDLDLQWGEALLVALRAVHRYCAEHPFYTFAEEESDDDDLFSSTDDVLLDEDDDDAAPLWF